MMRTIPATNREAWRCLIETISGGLLGGFVGGITLVPLTIELGLFITEQFDPGFSTRPHAFEASLPMVGGLTAFVASVILGAFLARAVLRMEAQEKAENKPRRSDFDDLF